MENGSKEVLLSVRNVRKYFPIRGGIFSSHIGDVRAVDGISFDIYKGETVGLVGESGCGKTTAGRLILRLIEPTSGHTFYRPPPEVQARLDTLYGELAQTQAAGDNGHADRKAGGAIAKELDGLAQKYSIYRMSGRRLHDLRGKLQIVFQDPFSSLSPRLLVRDIVSEPLEIHHMGTRAERYKRVAELLQAVGLNPEHLWRFPHEFSGGQRQRIGIARALALRPDFIVLDEPTSALDVSVQAQILNILKKLQLEQELSYLFISHHLSVVRAVSHRVVVMYLGKVAEQAPTEELFTRPLHPYTQALLAAIPIPDPDLKRERIILSGDVPSPAAPPPGCRFHTRCPAVMPICSKVEPPLLAVKPGHFVACHLYPAETLGGEGGLPVSAKTEVHGKLTAASAPGPAAVAPPVAP
ncbi:MAG TPA: ABC transporter ATP-binding protein [Thermoplasmata archaeon]|nr:ABC transporter ATP-binding protein [Thermoplasmata archaeon]